MSIHICVVDIGLDAVSRMMDVTGLIIGRIGVMRGGKYSDRVVLRHIRAWTRYCKRGKQPPLAPGTLQNSTPMCDVRIFCFYIIHCLMPFCKVLQFFLVLRLVVVRRFQVLEETSRCGDEIAPEWGSASINRLRSVNINRKLQKISLQIYRRDRFILLNVYMNISTQSGLKHLPKDNNRGVRINYCSRLVVPNLGKSVCRERW